MCRATKYTKAGDAIPIEKIFIRDTSKGLTYTVSPSEEVVKWEEYFTHYITWINSDELR
jgi:hypothetical protein